MNRNVVLAAAILLVAILGGGAVWWFGQGTEAPSVDVTAPPVETTTTEGTASADGAVTYALTNASTATFAIDEELRGQPATVVGTSTIVLGEIVLDDDDPAAAQVGTILVNARDFSTDSNNRNRAIRGPILDADIAGDLTIRDVANPVVFEVTGRLNSDETISGTATATVDRTDWGINIPSAPGVANVSETVTLTLNFVAAPTA